MAQLKALHRVFLKFIWNNKLITLWPLCFFSLQGHGVLQAHDIIKYYLAFHLRAIISWSSHTAPNWWSKIERGSLYPMHPSSLVWSQSLRNNFIMRRMCIAPMLFTMTNWLKMLPEILSLFTMPSLIYNFIQSGITSLSFGRMFPWMQASLFQLYYLVHPATRRLKNVKNCGENIISLTIHFTFICMLNIFSIPWLHPSLWIDPLMLNICVHKVLIKCIHHI